MTAHIYYRGVIAPLVTPLDQRMAVSEPCVARLIASLRGQVSGLMPALSSGEGWKLSLAQWRDMVRFTIRHAGGLPVLAGVQLATTAEVIERCGLAETLGVDAVVITTPFAADISQEEIVRHYEAIRGAVRTPIFIYNEAAISGNAIELATLRRICALPGLVGMKESSGSAELTRQLVADLPGLPIFEGWENLLYAARGVAGFIGPLVNLEPALCAAMLADPTEALQAKIDATCERLGLFKDDWYRWTKEELHRRGVIESARVVE